MATTLINNWTVIKIEGEDHKLTLQCEGTEGVAQDIAQMLSYATSYESKGAEILLGFSSQKQLEKCLEIL